MKQLKKTLLTLVALLAVTTGAWADGTYTVQFKANGKTVTKENVALPHTFMSGNSEFDQIMNDLYGNVYTFVPESTYVASLAVAESESVKAVKQNGVWALEISAAFKGTVTASGYYCYYRNNGFNYSIEISILTPSSTVEVAWDMAKKTGTFKMPGGNVTLEPEYYPQATVADGGVTAADADARATTDDPLVKVDATKLTGAKKLMYFVSNSGTTAPAYDAEGWTDQLPTAESITEQGIVYVYYYPVGTDEGVDGATATYSDGDICLESIIARIAAAPTYAVTFAEGTPETDKWTASPATGVKKGEPVTVNYTGSKKIIGVKAEKKSAAPSLNITNPTVGQVIGSDGKNYAAANVPSGVDKVAMIAYVSGSNGLAIALADEGMLNWATAKSTCEAKTPAFTNGTWKLPTMEEWKQMFSANGGSEGNYDGLNTAITTAGGTAFQDGTVNYWSSSEYDSDQAHLVQFYYGYASWFKDWKVNDKWVRAVLAF